MQVTLKIRRVASLGLFLTLAACQTIPGGLATPSSANPSATPQDAASVQAGSSPWPAVTDGQEGLRLVYVESNTEMDASLVYAASPSNIEDRQTLASITHRPGYPPVGKMSPGGDQVALLVVPSQASEAAARQDGGETWLVGMDGAEPRRVNRRSGYLLQWSPDGQTLAAGRYIPTAGGEGTLTPDRIEIFLINVGSASEQVIRTEYGSTAVRGLGWAPDSSRYYTALASQAGDWRIEAWDRQSASWSLVRALPSGRQYVSISLSPVGDRLLLVDDSGLVQVAPLEAGQNWPTLELAVAAQPGGSQESLYAAWQLDGSQLLLFAAGSPGASGSVFRVPGAASTTLVEDAALTSLVRNQPGLVPLGWSPGGAWLVLRDYGDPTLPLSLLPVQGGDLIRFEPGGYLTWIGWAGQ